MKVMKYVYLIQKQHILKVEGIYCCGCRRILNLTDYRPEEFLKAYVIEAELLEDEWIQKGTMSDLERKFTANIISSRKLMDCIPEIKQTSA